MHKVSLSYELQCVFIACGHLTKMKGCYGNCSGGLYLCAEYHG